MTKQQAPFRVDHVGSFLRPKELVEAREKFANGEITREELTAVEDKTIQEIVKKQIAAWEAVYSTTDELFEAIIKAYSEVIQDLYDAGLRTLQLDDCTWGALVDDGFAKRFREDRPLEEVRREFAARALRLNNGVIANAPKDLVINTHVCRGNFHSTWISQGGYNKVEDELLGGENVNAYYLEFDTERAGDFKPLAKVGAEKKVVLGLLTSKFADLENKDEIIARIKEASQYVPLENLYLSTQCGFASTEEGNVIKEEDQWKKIALISEIAREVWGE